MEDGSKLSFENKVANNFFKFLSREFYSRSMEDFEIFKFILKVLTTNKSKTIIYKYISILFQLLNRIVLKDNSIFNQIQYIINEALSSVLKSKQDYNIIIKYLVFLIEINEIDNAIRRIEELTLNQYYMNNGEIYFYKGLLEYLKNKNSHQLISQNFEKAINFITNEEFKYIEWIAKFYSTNNYTKELKDFLKLEKVKRIFSSNKIGLYQIISDNDNNDIFNKIEFLSNELTTNFWDLHVFVKFDTLIDRIQLKNKKRKFEKLLNLNRSYICIYVNFLISFFLFDPLNTLVNIKILSVLQEELAMIPNNEHQLKDSIVHLLETNYTLIIKIVVIKTLSRKLIKIYDNFSVYNQLSEEVQEIANVVSIVNLISLFLHKKLFFPDNMLLSKNFSQNTIKQIVLFLKNIKF